MNEGIRLAMHRALMAHKFDARKEDLKQRKYDLADESYMDLLTNSDINTLKSAPIGFFRETAGLYLTANAEFFNVYMSTSRRVPYLWQQYTALELSATMSKKWAKYERDKKQLEEEIEETGRTLSATLRTFRHVEDLIEAWPECKPYVPTDLKKAVTTALAIPPKKLNQLLGLP